MLGISWEVRVFPVSGPDWPSGLCMSQTLRFLSHWLALHSLLLDSLGSPPPGGPCSQTLVTMTVLPRAKSVSVHSHQTKSLPWPP